MKIIALVKDLFFITKIAETAKHPPSIEEICHVYVEEKPS